MACSVEFTHDVGRNHETREAVKPFVTATHLLRRVSREVPVMADEHRR